MSALTILRRVDDEEKGKSRTTLIGLWKRYFSVFFPFSRNFWLVRIFSGGGFLCHNSLFCLAKAYSRLFSGFAG